MWSIYIKCAELGISNRTPKNWWDDTLPRWVSANAGAAANRSLAGEFAEWQNLNHASMLPGSRILLSFLGDPQSSLYEGMTDAQARAAAVARLRAQHPQQGMCRSLGPLGYLPRQRRGGIARGTLAAPVL